MERLPTEAEQDDAWDLAREIEVALRRNSFWLRFTPNLEARFEHDTSPARRRPLLINLILGLVIYNLFGFVDPIAFPDILPEAFILRHVIYTVVSIAVVYGVYTATTAWVREMILLLGGLWSAGVTVLLIMLSDNTIGDQLLYSLMPMIMFDVLVLRQRFPYALALGIGFMIMHTAAMTTVAAENYLPGGTSGLVATVVLFTLMAGHAIENESRKNYLTSLREEMRRHSLEKLTLLDPLTVIGNRRALEIRLQELSDLGTLESAAIIFADIDHFKAYNDSFGHVVGDECLRRIAGLLVAEVRGDGNRVFRFGGEEFVAVLPGLGDGAAALVAERMRRAVARAAIPHCWPTQTAAVTVSFGVASLWPGEEHDIKGLLERADAALYRAKTDGRNCVRTATQAQPANGDQQAATKALVG